MSIISFIEEPKTIDKIIRHLGLRFEAERPPPPHHVQQELLMAAGETFLPIHAGESLQDWSGRP